jgi:hypothetical protein
MRWTPSGIASWKHRRPRPCLPRRSDNRRRNKWLRALIHRNFTLVKIGLRRVWGTIKV